MIITARVKTGQRKFLVNTGPVWTISVVSLPEKNRANIEIVKELTRLYGSCRILSGKTSKKKVIEVGDKS